MTEGLVVALVAAGAAVFGGLLTAFATRSVEKMRFQQAAEEKTAERKLAAVVRFTNGAFAWFDWLVLMADQGLGEDVLTEYNERSRERQQAYREPQLVCSTELFQWLKCAGFPPRTSRPPGSRGARSPTSARRSPRPRGWAATQLPPPGLPPLRGRLPADEVRPARFRPLHG